jgi:hypothetical protein
MLVIWGAFARQMGLIEALERVKIPQRTREHTPERKLTEFLVAILGGCEYLQDISHGSHPLDQDKAVAEAWGQSEWADYSGVSRTLKACTPETVAAIKGVLEEVSQPFIDQEVTLALSKQGVIIYDGDLTGRPVSNTSTSYEGAAFGWMSDEIRLGFQLALVSMHSPTYGRLWLSGQHHPGDTVSTSQAEALVQAAEVRTSVRPLRRTDLVQQHLAEQQQHLHQAREAWTLRVEQAQTALDESRRVEQELRLWQSRVTALATASARPGQPIKPYSRLAKAKDKVRVYTARLARRQQKVVAARRRIEREQERLQAHQQAVSVLQARLAQFEADNRANPAPIRAIIRLDAGFGSAQNVTWLIEMGYDLYSKPTNQQVAQDLLNRVDEATAWTPVGPNAELVTWSQQLLKHCPYPLNLALERFYTGPTIRYSTLLHYGADDVVSDPLAWFTFYNRRQLIEAGIKEGKSVFHLKHMPVHSVGGILIQELFALFVANFVRWAAAWLNQADLNPGSPLTHHRPNVKALVRIAANTSAWVVRQPDGGYLLSFTDASCYCGLELVVPGSWHYQLPLKLFSCKSADFSP